MWVDGAIKFLNSALYPLVNGLRNTEHKKTATFYCSLGSTNVAKCNYFHRCFGYGPYKTFCSQSS